MTPESYQPILTDPILNKQDSQKTQFFPFSFILLILWVAFTVILLWLLEEAVRQVGLQDVEPSFYRYLAILAGTLRTVFTQAHVPVTGMYLARVAVSTLHNPRSTPNSWTELFWLADREWMGPIGISKITFQSVRSRTRASLTFILFATTCTCALLTPVFLTRAYPVETAIVMRNITISPRTVYGDQLAAFTQLNIQAAAMGPWTMNVSVLEIYNSSLFTQPNQTRDSAKGSQPQDFFFANDIGNVTTTIHGLHMNGSCTPVDMSSTNLATLRSNNSLAQFCNSSIPHFQGTIIFSYGMTSDASPSFSLALNSCNNVTYKSESHPLHTENVGYFHYDYIVREGQHKRGLIQCRSALSTGVARVSGLSHTYTDFHEQELYRMERADGSKVGINTWAIDPLRLVFWGLAQTGNSTGPPRTLTDGLILGGLGFIYTRDGDELEYASPSPDDISRSLWSAMVHSVGALGVMSRDETPPFPASMPVPIAVYTRDLSYAFGAYILLALWLALISGITAWGYRRTFSRNLDSYVAAELISRERWLLEDVPIGEAGDNHRLKAPFKALNLRKEYRTGQVGFESERGEVEGSY